MELGDEERCPMIASELEIRPSALERLSLCPGSAHMEAAVRETVSDDSTEATLGSLMHAAVAECIERGVKQGVPFSDLFSSDMQLRYPLDAWSWTCVERCVDFAVALVSKYEITPDNILVEHKLDGADLGLPNGGTADLILVKPFEFVLIVDWKGGFIVQDDADSHDQLMAYAIMAGRTFNVKSVHVYLYQPRAEESARATAALFNAAALKSNEAWVRQVAADAQDPDADLRPSFNACKFCKALGVCPAAKEMVMRASEALANGFVPETPEAWGDLAMMAKLAGRFSDKAESLVKERLKAGEPVAGWEIGPGSVEKVIEDASACYSRMVQLGDTYAAGFWKAIKISRPELDKQCGSARAAYEDLLVTRERSGSLRQMKGSK